jgi:Peptidase family M23
VSSSYHRRSLAYIRAVRNFSRRSPHLLLTFFLYSLACLTASAQVSLRPYPSTPLVEVDRYQQLLNFDISAVNDSSDTLRLAEVEMTIYDPGNRFVLRKTINSNGLSPAIHLIADPLLTPGQTIDIFNPFYSVAGDVPISRMEFQFHFLRENSPAEREQNRHRLPMDYDLTATLSVSPRKYQTRANLVLPLQGSLLVWEGHDFFAHHRRVPLHASQSAKLGIIANANRYASDLVIVDDRGNMYHGDPWNMKNWRTYGATIYAPGEGIVAASENRVPDNEFVGKNIQYAELPNAADDDLGNYVLIDHGDGEYSFLPHMMEGSVLVKKGDHVRQGQPIGRVGFSGDAIFPHVHYALLSCADVHHCEGLPAYFHRVQHILGSKTARDDSAILETGNVIESTANYK